MSLDLNTSIDFLKRRIDATLSAQTSFATEWTWPLRTIAEWTVDSQQLDKSVDDSLASQAIAAHTRANSARGLLDARLATIHAQTVSVVGIMRVRAERSREHLPVVNELSSRGSSRREIEDEATALLSAWKEEFGIAFAPLPGITYESFHALFIGAATTPTLPSLRDLKQALSDAATIERKKVGALSVLLNRAERDAQDWYAEALMAFPAGTANGDIIRAIPTSTDYSPPSTPANPATPVSSTPA